MFKQTYITYKHINIHKLDIKRKTYIYIYKIFYIYIYIQNLEMFRDHRFFSYTLDDKVLIKFDEIFSDVLL